MVKTDWYSIWSFTALSDTILKSRGMVVWIFGKEMETWCDSPWQVMSNAMSLNVKHHHTECPYGQCLSSALLPSCCNQELQAFSRCHVERIELVKDWHLWCCELQVEAEMDNLLVNSGYRWSKCFGLDFHAEELGHHVIADGVEWVTFLPFIFLIGHDH